jgi:hypothetical protein
VSVLVLALALVPLAAAAQAWQQAETAHFLFIFEPRDRASVDELLTFCEDVYGSVTGFFGSFPRKVPVIIRGHRDDPNGVTMSLPARIDLYLTADTENFLGARSESWLRLLLTHELTHFVHQSMDTGLFHALSLAFGADLSAESLAFLPGWAVEGPAVYDETRFSLGGRGRNPLFEMYLKAAIEEARSFSLGQAGYTSAFPPPSRIYVAGDALVDWLQQTYGDDTLRRIMTAYLDFPFFGPWEAISSVTGRDAAGIFADMQGSLMRKYASDAALPGGKRITPQRIGSWEHPQATARGLYVYRTQPDAFPAIVRFDPSLGTETILANARLTDSASFSATSDGRTIWFSSLFDDESRQAEERTVADLFTVDLDTRTTRQVTRNAHLWHPAVSSDGATLVAVQGAGPYTRLVLVDTRTGALRVLFSRSEGNVYTPVLSPDGTRVAFTFNLRGVQDVYVADLPGLLRGALPLPAPDAPVSDVNVGLPRAVLGPDPFGEYFPSFIDKDRLLFSSDRTGSLALYTADLTTGAVARVQEDPVAAISGVALGDSLVYASYASAGYCLKRVPLRDLSTQPLDLSSSLDSPYPAGVAWTATAVPSRPYVDLPAPLLWLPQVTAAQTGPSDIDIGFGATLVGSSLLGATRWSIGAGWLVGSGQPAFTASFSSALGQLTLDLESSFSYAYAGSWTDSLVNSFTAEWTVFNEASLDSVRGLLLLSGIRQSSSLIGSGPFTFSDALAAPTGAWFTTLSVPLAARFQWQRAGSRLEFTPVLGMDAWLQATTYLPLLSLAEPLEVMDLFAAFTVPSPIPHQSFKIGMKAEQDIGAPYATWNDAFTLPRGFPETRLRASAGGMLGSIDYMAPIALLDQPLFLGFALTGAGVSVHAEALADFGGTAGTFTVSPVLYIGGDLTLRFVFNTFSFPVGIGVAAALDTASPSSFAPSTDLRVYLFTGFDSFGGSTAAPTARAEGAALSGVPTALAAPALLPEAGAWYSATDAR